MIKIKTISIIGANGTMGHNITELFVNFGGEVTIYLICRKYEDSELVQDYFNNSINVIDKKVKLIPKTFSDFDSSVSNSDLVLECVSEEINVKKHIFQSINQYLNEGTIVASGTSSLSINEMCMAIEPRFRKNFIGIHMFNPPSKMKLCELIPSNLTEQNLIDTLEEYLEEVLFRKVVVVKDQPGFLGNRVGFQILNEALQFAETYKEFGGVDYIDTILGKHTGRIMSPCVTIDYIGLDIHKLIVDNIYKHSDDCYKKSFKVPDYLNTLVSKDSLGRKTNIGLYRVSRINDGTKKFYVYDVLNNNYRLKVDYNMPFIEKIHNKFSINNYSSALYELLNDSSQEANICSYFMIKYCVYSIYIAKSSLKDIREVDEVMIYGFNWIPPLALIDAFGGMEVLKLIVKEKFADIFPQSEIDYLFKDLPKSKYSYEDYLK